MIKFSFGLSLLNEKENRELKEHVRSLEKYLKEAESLLIESQEFYKNHISDLHSEYKFMIQLRDKQKDELAKENLFLDNKLLDKQSEIAKLELKLEELQQNKNEVLSLYSQEQQKVIDLKARVIDLESIVKELQNAQ
jgi:hypothetical protein